MNPEPSTSQEAPIVDRGRTFICNQLDSCPGPVTAVTIGPERFQLHHHGECPMGDPLSDGATGWGERAAAANALGSCSMDTATALRTTAH